MSSPKYRRLSKDDAAVLFVDHQCGLLTLVQDYSPSEFKNAVLALADTAKYFKLPTILTTSFEEGPNGPIVPELKAMFPQAPQLQPGMQLFSLHAADGTPIMLTDSREAAIANAWSQELETVSVH